MSSMYNMLKLEVDGLAVSVKSGSTVRQAAEALGIELPRFCYHERLRVAGNCRICLVEVIGSPKPVASCAMPVSNGMKVFTSSPMVKKAREAVIELLRANHPLDCPICDQGGECDLQDQSMRYGSDRTRMYEPKRGVEDKYLGPLVKMVMTRCIHCTRCIRFASEVAGVGLLGTSGRGSDTEVGTYVERAIVSELSGNRIDRCPVGALTSKPMAFKARPWELDSIDTYDDTDSLISNVRVQIIGNTIYRVMPRNNDDVNGQWLADKGRFMFDSYNNIRTKRVMVRTIKGDYSIIDNIVDGIDYVGKVLDNMVNTMFVVSQSIDIDSLNVIKQVTNKLPSNHGLVSTGYSNMVITTGYKSEYSSTNELTQLNSTDTMLIVGVDMRKESPVVNTMIRNGYINGANIRSLGSQLRSTYPVESRANIDIVSMYNGTSNQLGYMLKGHNVSIISGTSVMQRDTSVVNMTVLRDIADNIAVEGGVSVNHQVVHTRANTVGAIIVGMPGYSSDMCYSEYESIINIGVLTNDSIEQGIDSVYNISDMAYTVMFTPWLDQNMSNMHDVIMPLVANHEQESKMVNTEGRYVTMKKVVTGTLSSDIGSVNAYMLSSLLEDGVVVNTDIGSYYNKRMLRLDNLYESVESECDLSNIPAVHNYYMEGHSGLHMSAKIAECSDIYNTTSKSFNDV